MTCATCDVAHLGHEPSIDEMLDALAGFEQDVPAYSGSRDTFLLNRLEPDPAGTHPDGLLHWHAAKSLRAAISCSECGKKYKSMRGMNNHRRKVHPGKGLHQLTRAEVDAQFHREQPKAKPTQGRVAGVSHLQAYYPSRNP